MLVHCSEKNGGENKNNSADSNPWIPIPFRPHAHYTVATEPNKSSMAKVAVPVDGGLELPYGSVLHMIAAKNFLISDDMWHVTHAALSLRKWCSIAAASQKVVRYLLDQPYQLRRPCYAIDNYLYPDSHVHLLTSEFCKSFLFCFCVNVIVWLSCAHIYTRLPTRPLHYIIL